MPADVVLSTMGGVITLSAKVYDTFMTTRILKKDCTKLGKFIYRLHGVLVAFESASQAGAHVGRSEALEELTLLFVEALTAAEALAQKVQGWSTIRAMCARTLSHQFTSVCAQLQHALDTLLAFRTLDTAATVQSDLQQLRAELQAMSFEEVTNAHRLWREEITAVQFEIARLSSSSEQQAQVLQESQGAMIDLVLQILLNQGTSQQRSTPLTLQGACTALLEAVSAAGQLNDVDNRFLEAVWKLLPAQTSSRAATAMQPPDHLLCPITLELMKDPVMLSSGHTYSRAAINSWLQANGTCPLTRQEAGSTMTVNHALQRAVQAWLQENPDWEQNMDNAPSTPEPRTSTAHLSPRPSAREGTRPSPVEGAITMPSSSLQHLADRISTADQPSTFDLGGATFSGPLRTLVLPINCNLRNGTLVLPAGVQVSVGPQGAHLADVSVRGAGVASAGLVCVQSGGCLTMERCLISGVTAGWCAHLLIDGSSTVDLTDCGLGPEGPEAGPGSTFGCNITGSRAALAAQGCQLRGTGRSPLYIHQGAQARLTDCTISGSKQWHGVWASDPQSLLHAKRCVFQGNHETGLAVFLGAKAELEDCRTLNNTAGSVCVEDRGSAVIDTRGMHQAPPVQSMGGAYTYSA